MQPHEDLSPPGGARRWSVAVVGAGTTGLALARELRRAGRFAVTVYEARAAAGGNCRTVTVGGLRIDPAVQVLRSPRDRAALDLVAQLGVRLAPVDASTSWVEERGRSWHAAVARPSARDVARMLPMLSGAMRLRAALDAIPPEDDEPLGAALARRGADGAATQSLFYPLCHAFWPFQRDELLDLPAGLVAHHAREHGLLRPWAGAWHRFEDGVADFTSRLIQGLDVRTGVAVRSVRRGPTGVELRTEAGTFGHDLVVLATAPRDALAILTDPSAEEKSALTELVDEPTRIVVHHDASAMPADRRDWATFNHRVHRDGSWSTTVWHNRLRGVGGPDVFATLHPGHRFDAVETLDFRHLRWTPRTRSAQAALLGLQGRRRTWWCGAWLGLGFQEDAVRSAVATASALGVNVRLRAAA